MMIGFTAPFYDRGAAVVASMLALAVVALGLSLGLWQLRRADEKIAMQLTQDRAAKAPALDLAAASSPPTALDGKRVQANGRFDAARSVFLDNRTREGIAGFHVLTPLVLTGVDRQVLVLRGWIARDPIDRNRLPDLITPPGPVHVEGSAQADLEQPMMLGDDPRPGPGDRLWQHFTFDKFREWSETASGAGSASQTPAAGRALLLPVILRQTVEPAYQDGLARDWNQPGLSVDRHRGYAFQWFALTAAAIAIWITLLWRQRAASHVKRNAG